MPGDASFGKRQGIYERQQFRLGRELVAATADTEACVLLFAVAALLELGRRAA